MPNRFRVSASLPRKLEDLGLTAAHILRHAALPVALLDGDRKTVTTAELFAFYRALTDVSCDPSIGLKLGTEDRIERYDPIAITALCTRSFRDALDRMARYKQLTCPEKIELLESDDEYSVRFNFLLADEEDQPAVLIDLCFAWILSVARRGMGFPLQPKRVEYRRPAAHREIYESHFGCQVKFDASQNVLVFHRHDLDRTFLTHNSELLAIVAPQLEAELSLHLAENSIAERVKGTVKRLLAGQRPGIADVARELRMSTRTLQRRLTEERITFQQLMQEARRELARHYLQHSSLELNETAYLLGFEDANSFFRAFQGWEGTTPGQWRALHSVSRGPIMPLRTSARTA